MKNSAYWTQRFSQLEDAQNKIGASSLSDIEKQYRKAQKQIEGQIAMWYQRFANNNEITLAEARQYMRTADLKEFKWDVQDYIKYGQEAGVSGAWIKELENASARYHVSKLEALKIQTQNSLETLFAEQGITLSSALGDVYRSGYYHTAYELQKGFGIGFEISGVDQSQLEKILSKPWAVDKYNFSERIWNNKEKLISTVHNELTQNIMLGKDPQKAIDAIAKQMNNSKFNAGRLVMTEEAYFSSAAQKDCFNELGVEEYEIVATLDSKTSEICQSMDGQHFPMKAYQAGVTAPPFHVWCRSTTAPYFDEQFDIGERAARDENGNTVEVPADMTYEEWKQKFVDIDDENDIINEKNISVNDCTNHAGLEDYLTKQYSINYDKTVKNLNFEVVQSVMSGVESTIREFPELGTSLQKILTGNNGVMSCVGTAIKFNPKYFSDAQTLKQACLDMSNIGYWVKNSSLGSIGVHESAHGVEWLLINANSNYTYEFERILAWNDCSEAKMIVSKAVKNIKKTSYGKGKKRETLIRSISGYANENDSEALAEAFADIYANGANANPLSVEIKRLSVEKYSQYKKGGIS